MTTLEGTIARRDGVLYVRYTDTLWTEPVSIAVFYRIVDLAAAWGGFGGRPEEGDTVRSSRGDRWTAFDAKTGREAGVVFTENEPTLKHGERTPVPPPPARGKELRWRDGRWEKLLKKGWVPV